MNALIVDDSSAMRRILRKMVEPLGFNVTEAGNGIEGLNRLCEMPDVKVIFVDWNMPVMDGLTFVKTIRAHADYQSLKVVMVTSETEPSKMARALMTGVDEFVMKPFTLDVLLAKLELIGVEMPAVA